MCNVRVYRKLRRIAKISIIGLVKTAAALAVRIMLVALQYWLIEKAVQVSSEVSVLSTDKAVRLPRVLAAPARFRYVVPLEHSLLCYADETAPIISRSVTTQL